MLIRPYSFYTVRGLSNLTRIRLSLTDGLNQTKYGMPRLWPVPRLSSIILVMKYPPVLIWATSACKLSQIKGHFWMNADNHFDSMLISRRIISKRQAPISSCNCPRWWNYTDNVCWSTVAHSLLNPGCFKCMHPHQSNAHRPGHFDRISLSKNATKIIWHWANRGWMWKKVVRHYLIVWKILGTIPDRRAFSVLTVTSLTLTLLLPFS